MKIVMNTRLWHAVLLNLPNITNITVSLLPDSGHMSTGIAEQQKQQI